MGALPFVSLLVPTFGRTLLLAEVIECFRRQDYTGQLEMVVLNDCPMHTLSCELNDTPERSLRMLNVAQPFHSLAVKRNALLEAASGEACCIWDDDDIYLPSLVSELVAKLRDGEPAARTTRLMMWDGRIAKVQRGSQHHNAIFRTEALRRLGGWRDIESSDPDLIMRGAMRGFFAGRHHHEDDGKPPAMIYRDDAGRTHMEGGNGKRERISAGEFQKRQLAIVSRDRKQKGAVVIVPAWSQDWVAFRDAHYNAPVAPTIKAKPKKKGKTK